MLEEIFRAPCAQRPPIKNPVGRELRMVEGPALSTLSTLKRADHRSIDPAP